MPRKERQTVTRSDDARALMNAQLSENVWQKTVLEAATRLGWHSNYIPDWLYRSMQKGRIQELAEKGFPDLFLVRAPEFMYVELKSETGTVRPEQRAWLDRLAQCGIETHVWKPRHWDDVIARLSNATEYEDGIHP